MAQASLPFLTDEDLATLGALAEHRAHVAGDVIIEEGSRQRELLLIRKGKVRIERVRGGQPLVYGILGEGEVLGEMSFLEDAPASAQVVADGPLELDVVPDGVLSELLDRNPSLGRRFYRSLAVAVSRRLRLANRRLQEANARETPDKRALPSEDTVPPGLRLELREFRRTLTHLEGRASKGELAPQEAMLQVRNLTDELMNGLTAQAGILDPGLLGGVFRELFPELMRSATISACYSRPGGYPADIESLAMVHEKSPMGDGDLGRWVDAWFLGRPLARGIRDGSRLLARLVSQVERRSPGARLLLLGAPAGAELTSVLFRQRDEQEPTPRLTIIDPDDWALARVSSLAKAGAPAEGVPAETVTLAHQSFDAIVSGEATLHLEPQQLIASLRLAEFSSDDELLTALEWIHAQLAPGGVALLANVSASHPDRLLVSHLLDWPMVFRSREELSALLHRSPFDRSRIQLDTDRAGSRTFAILQR